MSKRQSKESGNAFFIVLISVVLFAALMYTFSRGARQGGESMSSKQVELGVDELMAYNQQMQRAIDRMRGNDVSENEICFDSDMWPDNNYNFAACADTEHQVFHPDGGGITWQSAPESLAGPPGTYTYFFTGSSGVEGLGKDSRAELIMQLFNVSEAGCIEINNRLGVENPSGLPPTVAPNGQSNFVGIYSDGDLYDEAEIEGHRAFCGKTGGQYRYQFVLLER